MSIVGLAGVSKKNTLVFGRIASTHAWLSRASMVVEVARLSTQLDELQAQHANLAKQPDRGLAVQQVERSLIRQRKSAEEALKRIEAGTYGICLKCRNPIELDRLEARPSAEHCRGCSQGSS